MQTLTRRTLLASTAAGTMALALSGTAVMASASIATDPANCAHDHERMGYRLGAHIVDPAVSEASKNHAIKTAHCPSCGTGIAPSGLAFDKHMWG